MSVANSRVARDATNGGRCEETDTRGGGRHGHAARRLHRFGDGCRVVFGATADAGPVQCHARR